MAADHFLKGAAKVFDLSLLGGQVLTLYGSDCFEELLSETVISITVPTASSWRVVSFPGFGSKIKYLDRTAVIFNLSFGPVYATSTLALLFCVGDHVECCSLCITRIVSLLQTSSARFDVVLPSYGNKLIITNIIIRLPYTSSKPRSGTDLGLVHVLIVVLLQGIKEHLLSSRSSFNNDSRLNFRIDNGDGPVGVAFGEVFVVIDLGGTVHATIFDQA